MRKVAGPALNLANISTNAAATTLNISVASGRLPPTVNATAGKPTNLNPDKLDGRSSGGFYATGSTMADSTKLAGKGPEEFLPIVGGARRSHPAI